MADEITMMSRMRHRITLQSPDLTAESGGQFAVSWEDMATVCAEMRVVFDGRYFNIRSVVNTDESGQWLRLLVEENAAI